MKTLFYLFCFVLLLSLVSADEELFMFYGGDEEIQFGLWGDTEINSFSSYSPIIGGVGGGGGGGGKLELSTKWIFEIGDGICQYSLGEDKGISPIDCKYSIHNYLTCLKNRKECFPNMFNQILSAFLVTIVLVIITTYILKKRKNEKKKAFKAY